MERPAQRESRGRGCLKAGAAFGGGWFGLGFSCVGLGFLSVCFFPPVHYDLVSAVPGSGRQPIPSRSALRACSQRRTPGGAAVCV